MINTQTRTILEATHNEHTDRFILDVVFDGKGAECFTITFEEDHGHRRERHLEDVSFDRAESIETFVKKCNENNFTIQVDHSSITQDYITMVNDTLAQTAT